MSPAPGPSRIAYALLGAMTVVSFGGPFLLLLVIGGGQNPKWPPDRPIEWIAFATVITLACILMGLCLSIRLWLPSAKSTAASSDNSSAAGPPDES